MNTPVSFPVAKLIDRYWELRREILNTPPIYFLRLKRLFREYKEVKEKLKENDKTIILSVWSLF